MAKIEIRKVSTNKEMDDFIHVVDHIYKGCEQYVPDLESGIRDTFNPQKNDGLKFTKLQPFVAYKNGEPAGRILGIINQRSNKKWNVENVRFSMIEFIDDEDVSRGLLKAVERWGIENDMDAIQGPLGITDYDKEGMLIEDFDKIGSISMTYNPEYYPRHMELMGYRKQIDWVQVHIDIPKETPAKYARVAEYCRTAMGLRVIKTTNKALLGELGQEAFRVFNAAYSGIFGFTEFTPEQAYEVIDKYIRMIDKDLLPIIVDSDNKVVGLAVTMGSISKAMQKAKGRLLPFGWYHLLKALYWKHEDNAEMLLIAVRPDYQGLGVNAMFFDDLIPIYNRKGFKWAETGPQLEDNIRELTQWKPLNPKFVKRRRCYIKELRSKL